MIAVGAAVIATLVLLTFAASLFVLATRASRLHRRKSDVMRGVTSGVIDAPVIPVAHPVDLYPRWAVVLGWVLGIQFAVFGLILAGHVAIAIVALVSVAG